MHPDLPTGTQGCAKPMSQLLTSRRGPVVEQAGGQQQIRLREVIRQHVAGLECYPRLHRIGSRTATTSELVQQVGGNGQHGRTVEQGSGNTDQLLTMKRTPGVYLELLFRAGVQDNVRKEALVGLASSSKKGELPVLLSAVRTLDQSAAQAEGVAYDLVRLLTDRPAAELLAARKELQDLADTAKTPVIRRLAIATLITADGSPDAVWANAQKSLGAMQDTVSAVALCRDVATRLAVYPKLAQLLTGLPANLAAVLPKDKQVTGRYVRIDLPGPQRTLTLAEVEVMSRGVNIARAGKAKQSSTSNGGVAARAIDGNKSASYGDGGQTHTAEGTDNPWWELDLGGEFPVETA